MPPIVEVFAFGIDVPADRAALEQRSHRKAFGPECRRFIHHVDFTALFRGRDYFRDKIKLIDSEKRGTRACDMEAAVKRGNGKPGVAGSVGGDIERFDFVGGGVFDEFFAAGVSLLCPGAFL